VNHLPPFAYFAPRSIAEAVAMLTREGVGAYPLAGGTDLLVRGKRGHPFAKTVVNLKLIPELRGIEELPDGIRIGALEVIAALQRSALIARELPVLAEAAERLGSPSIRNMATLGGNIGRASPASDMAPALIVLDATLTVEGPTGRRTLPVESFFRGPGVTVLTPGEVITNFLVPKMPGRSAATYERLGRSQGTECALLGVASLIALAENRLEAKAARIALAAVAPVPMRSKRAEAALLSGPLTEDRLWDAARGAAADCMPITDIRATAAYRREMVEVMTLRGLRRAWEQAVGGRA